MKNENCLLDGLISDCLDDESNLNLEGFSSYALSNSDSQNSDAKDIKGNSYFVSENIEDQLEKADLNGLGELNLLNEKCSDTDYGSIDDILQFNENSEDSLKDENELNVFIISDTTGNNLFDNVACEILENSSFSNVKFNIRSGDQIKSMDEEEIYDLMNSCDAFIGQWVSSNVDAVLTSLDNFF